MLYPELFKQLEAVRWNMDSDIPWAGFDASRMKIGSLYSLTLRCIPQLLIALKLRKPDLQVDLTLVPFGNAGRNIARAQIFFPSRKCWRSWPKSPTRWITRTNKASSIATSSPPTLC